MSGLIPQVIERNGEKQFVLLPYAEYVELTEELEDFAHRRAPSRTVVRCATQKRLSKMDPQ